MVVTDLKPFDIKISKNSITAKDPESGKTKGVVREIQSFKNLPIKNQFEHSKVVKKIIAENPDLKIHFDDLYVKDRKIYYFVSENSIHYFPEMIPMIENLERSDLLEVVRVRSLSN